MGKVSLRKIVEGLAVTVLLYSVFLEIYRIKQLENIDFESVARQEMQEAAAYFNRLFSETDSLCKILSLQDGVKLSAPTQ